MSTTERPDLGAVLDHYGVVHRSSRSTEMVSCALHEDRTPSMSLNKDKGLWSCKSCGKGGDAWTLIMEKESTDFHGARTIAAGLGIEGGGAGGSDGHVRGSAHAGGRTGSDRSRSQPRGGGWKPSWRRG